MGRQPDGRSGLQGQPGGVRLQASVSGVGGDLLPHLVRVDAYQVVSRVQQHRGACLGRVLLKLRLRQRRNRAHGPLRRLERELVLETIETS